MRINVVYKLHLNRRNKIGQFYKEIAKICSEEENEYLQVALYRQKNKDENVRYVLGHPKKNELDNYTILNEVV